MKAKYLWLLLLAVFFGCDDSTKDLGLEMLPGSDMLVVKAKNFDVRTRSILSGPVFAKTNIGYIGKFTDPDFGFYEAGFLTQLNCTDNFKFQQPYDEETGLGHLAGDTVYDVFLQLSYDEYFGDSLNTCRMSVYELNKRLEKNHFTDINPEEYYDEKDLIGRRAYTAVDLSVSDTIRNSSSYTNSVTFPLPKEFGNDILKLNWEHPEYFKNADAFIDNVFKGIYARCDYGDGTVLYIDQVELVIRYWYHLRDAEGEILKKKDGTDSLAIEGRSFAATKEVIQANRFANSEVLGEIVDNETNWTYLKSPAGIFTQVTLPVQEMYDELHADTLNSIKLLFTAYQQKKHDNVDEIFMMNPPNDILMVREKDAKSFFEENKLYDNQTSFLASFASSQYVFSNITALIKNCIAEKEAVRKAEGKDWTATEWKAWEEENKWNSVVLIPVIINRQTQNNTTVVTSIQNDMKPGYVKLKGGNGPEGDVLDLEVHYTVFY